MSINAHLPSQSSEVVTPTRGDLSRDRWLSIVGAGTAAFALNHAIQLKEGSYTPTAFKWVALALAACTLGVLLPIRARWDRHIEPLAKLACVAGIAWQLKTLMASPPAFYLQPNTDWVPVMRHAAMVFAALTAMTFLPFRVIARLQTPILLAFFFALGCWLIKYSPKPWIDVWLWHQISLQRLVHGINPFVAPLPNIYGNTPWYGPDLVHGAEVRVGYQYPPLSILVALPGYLLAGDYRYSALAAMVAGAGFMAYAVPGRIGSLVAIAYLCSPRILFVLEQGWTEPFFIMFVALTVLVARRAPKFLSAALSGILAIKQYSFLAVPGILLLFPGRAGVRKSAKVLGVAIAIGLVFTIPLALWDVRAFVNSVLLFQFRQPFRPDSLSAASWWFREHGGAALSSLLPFGLAAVAIAISLWRAPKTPSGFAMALGFALFAFLFAAKQSFCNHYFAAIGTFFCACAGIDPRRNAHPVDSSRGAD